MRSGFRFLTKWWCFVLCGSAILFLLGNTTYAQDGAADSDVFSDLDDDASFELIEPENNDDSGASADESTTGDQGSDVAAEIDGRIEPPKQSPDIPSDDTEIGSEPTIQELPESPAIPDDDSPDVLPDQIERETIRERYPDGKVKIERQVTQDENENFVNHGHWVMYDVDGNEVIRGQYDFGKRHGEWFRWYEAKDAELFELPPYNQYQGPFKSTARFSRGKLDGPWIIEDATGRKISEWNFVNGRRDGRSIWYYNNQQPMRVIHYSNGELHGDLIEYDPTGRVVTQVEYINGRRLEKVTRFYDDNPQQKMVEGVMLRARYVLKQPDDWWTATVAKYTKEGKDEKHGKWTAWYPNGQKRMEGEYQYDQPSGRFIWWHENGQKSLEGSFSAGKKEGLWTWWHKNGLRAIQGSYADGAPTGRWIWWHENGKVSQRIDYGGPTGESIVTKRNDSEAQPRPQ